jgi:hypothetical protein
MRYEDLPMWSYYRIVSQGDRDFIKGPQCDIGLGPSHAFIADMCNGPNMIDDDTEVEHITFLSCKTHEELRKYRNV